MNDISPKSLGSEIEEAIKNMTSTSCTYSSASDVSRNHLRLKMSDGTSKAGLVLPNGRPPMQIPSLLKKLPCHGTLNNNGAGLSSSVTSAASAVTLSALNVIESLPEKDGVDLEQNVKAATDLDAIDLENITIADLNGLKAADGDVLRAKHLNKLSRKEREHVFEDMHGVADEESSNLTFEDDSLEKLQVEIDRELAVRKVNKNSVKKVETNEDGMDSKMQQETEAPQLPALKEKLGKVQEQLDQLVRRRNNLDSIMNRDSEFSSRKQLSAKNHPMYGKLGDIGGFGSFPYGSNSGSKNNMRPSAVTSSSFFSPTTAMAKSPLSTVSTNEAQHDATILKNKNAIAYEQALAQCRGRRRERNNSLFRPNTSDDDGDEDDVFDGGLFIDVEHRDFRLSFLRAERYDIKKSAKRIIEYFEEKRRLFGVNNLTSKMKLKDLDSKSRDCLESGQIQLLPGRDRAGRAVIVETAKLASNRQDTKSVLRAFWILSSIALENVETEKNGVVFVKYDIGGAGDDRTDRSRRRICDWGNVLKALPLRIASMHWCVQTHVQKQAANLSALMLGGSIFLRVRCHVGTDMEVQYALMTSGIPTDLFPVSAFGKIDLSRHIDFLQQRKKMEASSLLNKALALVEAPMLDDCIALDDCDDDQNLSVTRRDHFPSTMTSGNIFNQNQVQFQQEQELNRAVADYGFGNNNMNKMSSLNDPFCFIGNRNPMQVQSSFQQQYHQRQHQQQLNDLQQQQLGMNMNMGMGMVQQFSRNQQIQNQQNTSKAESKSGIAYSMEPVLVPGELDILLGRGRGAQNHKGNIHYRQVVETFRSRYEQIPQKGAKTQLIREVVAVIYDNGGRFLKQDGFGRWIPVDPEVARDKVSHSFRNQKRLSTGGNTPESGPSRKRSRDD